MVVTHDPAHSLLPLFPHCSEMEKKKSWLVEALVKLGVAQAEVVIDARSKGKGDDVDKSLLDDVKKTYDDLSQLVEVNDSKVRQKSSQHAWPCFTWILVVFCRCIWLGPVLMLVYYYIQWICFNSSLLCNSIDISSDPVWILKAIVQTHEKSILKWNLSITICDAFWANQVVFARPSFEILALKDGNRLQKRIFFCCF